MKVERKEDENGWTEDGRAQEGAEKDENMTSRKVREVGKLENM